MFTLTAAEAEQVDLTAGEVGCSMPSEDDPPKNSIIDI